MKRTFLLCGCWLGTLRFIESLPVDRCFPCPSIETALCSRTSGTTELRFTPLGLEQPHSPGRVLSSVRGTGSKWWLVHSAPKDLPAAGETGHDEEASTYTPGPLSVLKDISEKLHGWGTGI